MSTEISDQELIELLKICEAATPGPWGFHGYTKSYHIARVLDGHFHSSPRVVHATLGTSEQNWDDAGGVREYADAKLIAITPTALPRVIRALQESRTERLEIQRALASSVLNDPTEDDKVPYSTTEMVNGIIALIQRKEGLLNKYVRLHSELESERS